MLPIYFIPLFRIFLSIFLFVCLFLSNYVDQYLQNNSCDSRHFAKWNAAVVSCYIYDIGFGF